MHNASAAAAVLCLLTVIKVSLKNKVTLVGPFSRGKIKGMNVQLIEIVIQIILIHKNINCVQWNVISYAPLVTGLFGQFVAICTLILPFFI